MRFRLEKYAGPSSRYTCPACRRPKKFTRYVDTETGEYLSSEIGRCDRESSCGYHKKPRDYFAERNESLEPKMHSRVGRKRVQQYPRNVSIFDTTPARRLFRIEAGIVLETLEASRYSGNHLLNFLFHQFRREEEAVINAFKKYLVGTGVHGETIFWQIDERREVRSGKVILYDPGTGRRRKDRNPNWVHSILKRSGQLPATFDLRQCFFGQHLLRNDRHTPIAIVEAEKTAVVAEICSSTFPRMIWLASGGKSGLTVRKLEQVAAGRLVILYPDADAFESWNSIADAGRRQGIDVRVSFVVRHLSKALGNFRGLDIADCLLEIRAQENRQTLLDDALRETCEERMAIMTIDGRLSEQAAKAHVLATEIYPRIDERNVDSVD